MALDLNTFIRLYGRVKADWDKGAGKHWWIVPLNLALEGICRESPRHTDPAQVYAKVRLINRAYSANLQRNRKVQWPEWEVAKAFAKAADSIMRPLCSLPALDQGTVTQVVECHSELMGCARRVTRI